MNTVFFGTPEFGAIILEKLIEKNLKPILVVTAPDEPAGRKQLVTPSPVKVVAQRHTIPVLQPDTLNQDVVFKLREVKAELFILASYGRIIPKEILALASKGALNVHPSLLPRYRGPSPIQSVILQGEEKTGVTIILMDEDIDHGPILAQREFAEHIGEMTQEELKEKLADVGGDLLVEAVFKWLKGDIAPQPQNHGLATFTKKMSKEDGKIDWKGEALYIARQIRAFNPWPGTFTFWNSRLLKILKASIVDSPGYDSFAPGSMFSLKGKPVVATGNGALMLERIQLEGKNPVSARDFLLGHKDFIEAKLS
ncbi:MAG: methionyl-tRNA formyltransferase [bacterium]|nr:methionyl-tRNA formyltransferase [bacterium]